MIDPRAFVPLAVGIGKDTNVWQFASVIRGAVIGQRCSIGAGAMVDAAIIGDDCRIGCGAQLHPGTVIGSGVFVGPGAIFCNDAWPRVSRDGFDMGKLLSGEMVTVRVRDDAVIGAGCVILPGVTIGRGAFVSAGVTLNRSVADFYFAKRSGDVVPLSPRRAERMRAAC